MYLSVGYSLRKTLRSTGRLLSNLGTSISSLGKVFVGPPKKFLKKKYINPCERESIMYRCVGGRAQSGMKGDVCPRLPSLPTPIFHSHSVHSMN
jgi:hypothetical protein